MRQSAPTSRAGSPAGADDEHDQHDGEREESDPESPRRPPGRVLARIEQLSRRRAERRGRKPARLPVLVEPGGTAAAPEELDRLPRVDQLAQRVRAGLAIERLEQERAV